MNILEFLRHYRIGPFSVFDFAVSYLGFWLLAPYIIKLFARINVNFTKANIMWLVLPLSVLIHLAVSRHTPLTKMVIDPNNYYLLKILLMIMIYFGFRKVIW